MIADDTDVDEVREFSAAEELNRCDREETMAGSLLRQSFVWLVIAVAAWILGSAWWRAQSLGASRWLGAMLDLVGCLGTLGAIGMIWGALRWKRARTLRRYLITGSPTGYPDTGVQN
ncbi:MAG: hypothetical protein ACLQPH_10130 [Acidimicrobiales bacterium]